VAKEPFSNELYWGEGLTKMREKMRRG